MKRFFAFLLFVFVAFFANAQGNIPVTVQGKPLSSVTEVTTLSDNDVVMIAVNNYWRKIKGKDLRKKVAPYIAQNSINYLPAPSGNTLNLNVVFKSSADNHTYYIDPSGTSICFDCNSGGDNSVLNEIQTLSKNSTGGTLVLSKGTLVSDFVKLPDSSAVNEIQTLTLTGQTLNLSKNGGSVTLPTPVSDNFANADLTATGDRTHNFGVHNLSIVKNDGITSNGVLLNNSAFIYSQKIADNTFGTIASFNGEVQLESNQNFANRKIFNVKKDGFYMNDGVNNTGKLMMIEDSLGKVKFLDKDSLGLNDTNLGNTDMTLGSSRTVNLNGNVLNFVGTKTSDDVVFDAQVRCIDDFFTNSLLSNQTNLNNATTITGNNNITGNNTITAPNGFTTTLNGNVRITNTNNNTGNLLQILNSAGDVGFVTAPSGGLTNIVGGEGVTVTNSNVVNLGSEYPNTPSVLSSKRYFLYSNETSADAGLIFSKDAYNGSRVGTPFVFRGRDTDDETENTKIDFVMRNPSGDSMTHSIFARYNGFGLYTPMQMYLNSDNNIHCNAGEVFWASGTNQVNMATGNGYGILAYGNNVSSPLYRMRIGKTSGATSPFIQFGDAQMSVNNLPAATAANTHVLTGTAGGGTLAMKSIASIVPAATFNLSSSGNLMTAIHNNVVFDAPIVNSNTLAFQNGQLTTTVNGVSSAPLAVPFSPWTLQNSGSIYNLFVSSLAPAQQPDVRVAIGKQTAAEMLDVEGKTKVVNFQMTAGAAVGAVMTSDANGNASWDNTQLNNIVHTAAVTWLNNAPVVYSATDVENIYNFTKVGNTIHFDIRIKIGNIQPNIVTEAYILLPHTNIGSLVAQLVGNFPSSATATDLDFVKEGHCFAFYPTAGSGRLGLKFISTADAQICSPSCLPNIGYLNLSGSYKIV